MLAIGSSVVVVGLTLFLITNACGPVVNGVGGGGVVVVVVVVDVVLGLAVVAADVLRLGGSVKGDLGLPLLGFLVVTGFGVVVVCRVGA